MRMIISILIPVIGSLLLMACIFYGMEQIGDREKRKRWIRISVCSGYSIFTVILSMAGNGLVNLIILLIIPFLAQWLFGKEKIHLFYYYVIIIGVYLMDVLLLVLFQQLIAYGIIYLNSEILYQALFSFILRLIELLLIRCMVLMIRHHGKGEVTGKQVLISLVIPMFSIVNLFSFLYFMQIYLTEEMLALFIFNLILLLGINIYFAYLIDTMSKNNRLENELNLYREQARLQVNYYQREEKRYEESGKLIHDIRNHISALEQLYREDDSNQAAAYAGDIHGMLNRFNQTYYTSEKLLNIILNEKVDTMKNAGIYADIRIGEISLSFMKEVEVTTVFANLLDNAIEAAGKAHQPFAKLRVNLVGNFLSIHMENSCDSQPVKKGAEYKTTKKGQHGYGLKNIRRVVDQYDGDMQCDWEDGVFTTTIMLQKP